MYKNKRHGYFHRLTFPIIFMVMVVANLYFFFFESEEVSGAVVVVSFILFLTFVAGILEGSNYGREKFIEDMETDSSTRNTYLKRFNEINK